MFDIIQNVLSFQEGVLDRSGTGFFCFELIRFNFFVPKYYQVGCKMCKYELNYFGISSPALLAEMVNMH